MEGEAGQAYDFAKELKTQAIEWATGDPDLTPMDRETIVCSANSFAAAIGAAGVRAGRWSEQEAEQLLTPHTTPTG